MLTGTSRLETCPYEYSHTIGLYSLLGRGFNNPVDVAFGKDVPAYAGVTVMYVLNRAGPEVASRMPNKRISMCTVDEEYLGEFSGGGVEDGQMMWPSSIATDRDGNVYVSDEALQRITIFDGRGRYLDKWGTKGRADGEFNRPSGIAFDADDNLLVTDSLNCRVQRYTREGRFLESWGRPGRADGEFNLPWGIHVSRQSGDVLVADWRNDRVQRFDAGGRHTATYGASGDGDGELNRPAGVTTDTDGNIYVADWGNERVQALRPDGSFLANMRGESGISKWGHEYFEVNADELRERRKSDMEPELGPMARGSSREESANIEKLFWGPTAVKMDDEGRMFVVESCRFRIQVYQRA